MLYSTLAVAFATFASYAAAQLPPSVGPCCTIPTNSVNSTVRQQWCKAQTNTCPEVCGGFDKLNMTCVPETLTYTCVCGDGTTPNLTDYQQTVPGLMCRQWFIDCIAASGDNLAQQEACKAVQCGNKTTNAAQSSAASSTPTGSSVSSTGGSAASATAEPSSSSSSAAAATAVAIAREYGTPLLAGGIAALFGLAL